MKDHIGDDTGALIFRINNVSPVSLEDFSNSIKEFGRVYEDFLRSEKIEHSDVRSKLYIHRLETGSLIAVLHSIAEQASLIFGESGLIKTAGEAFKHAEAIAPFLTQFNELVQFFLGNNKKGEIDTVPSKRQAEQIIKIFEPIAKDSASSLSLQFNGPVNFENITLNYNNQEANAAQNNAKRFLGPSLPAMEKYTDEVLVLHQIRDSKSTAGDRGIIESISDKPIKLWFSSESAKKAIMEKPENPFQLAFIVDVIVKTIDNSPALYKIIEVKDSFERPDKDFE